LVSPRVFLLTLPCMELPLAIVRSVRRCRSRYSSESGFSRSSMSVLGCDFTGSTQSAVRFSIRGSVNNARVAVPSRLPTFLLVMSSTPSPKSIKVLFCQLHRSHVVSVASLVNRVPEIDLIWRTGRDQAVQDLAFESRQEAGGRRGDLPKVLHDIVLVVNHRFLKCVGLRLEQIDLVKTFADNREVRNVCGHSLGYHIVGLIARI
jgi:hypothetical protein